ncbi:MAG: formyltetrahydrofolate deformylase [Knoellia sp.]
MSNRFVLTLSCPDRAGIVHAVTSVLVDAGCDITEHQQFDDSVHGLLFLRTGFEAPNGAREQLEAALATVATAYGMTWQLHDATRRTRVLVMASKFGHCLNDLLYRWQVGSLGVDIALVVSNHPDLGAMAGSAGVPFMHVPVTPETKAEAEARLLALIDRHEIDLVVLARYMQVLSNDLCRQLEGRAINIHHSFLPSFKGAKPYHQAFSRGVKQVGATSHYVTPDLDEGPIIEQEVIRVDHTYGPEDLVTAGRDAESLALARAVIWHGQHRILLNNDRTVVFR